MKAGFRTGDDAPMAVIELVDRDTNAKKIDVKKKPSENEDKTETQTSKKEESSKKVKPKK